MKELLKSCLEAEKIEYYAVLDYGDCRVTLPRLVDRTGIMPRSVIVFLMPYFVSVPTNFSAYAASRDYHLAVKEITDRIISRLKDEWKDYSFFGFGDRSPIDERYAALVGGLGVLGNNRLVLNERYGSYFFIAEIITDAPAELLGAKKPIPVSHCISCGRCEEACPTGVLRGACQDCLSAITQRKGYISDVEAECMREANTVWGCDACQRCCPYNATPAVTPIEFFHSEVINELSPELLSGLTDEELSLRAFAWRGRKTVERNLAILSEKNIEKAKTRD